MTSIYDVLKASKGVHVDDTFAELWGRKLSNTYSVATYTGTLPATLTGTKAGYLKSYKIYGNTVQDGTPTPENPIDPTGCGVRTENLFDGELLGGHFVSNNFVTAGNEIVYKSIKVWLPAGTYTFSWGKNVNVIRTIIDGVYRRPTHSNISHFTFTSTANDYVGISFRDAASSSAAWDITTSIMLNLGSTALPYEPYGYKLPILSNDTPIDIYLGDEPLRKIDDYADYIDYGTGKIVRQVEKIELTGSENISKNSGSATNYLYYTRRSTLTDSIPKTPIVCDRLQAVGEPPAAQIGINANNIYNMVYLNFGADIMNAQPSGNTIDGFKEYLAAQYTSGTPVTIWYVLATPVEETPPVPFPQIPTFAGTTVIDWAGEGLAPSEVELAYRKPKGQ